MNTYRFTAYGRQWTMAADDPVIEENYRAGRFDEAPMLAFVLDHIPRGGIWVDCGANIGNHALPFSTRADLVVCFEPYEANLALLRQNVAANGAQARVMPLGLATGLGPNLFSMTKGGVGRNSQWRLGVAVDADPKVAVVSLDAVIPHENVRLLKIDVEGFEEFTLVGAKNIISASKPEVFVEIWDEATFGWVREYLGGMGYELIERWNHAPTYHFSASGRFPVTYQPPKS